MVSMSEVGQIQQKLTKSNEIKSLRFFKKGQILMHRLQIHTNTEREVTLIFNGYAQVQLSITMK